MAPTLYVLGDAVVPVSLSGVRGDRPFPLPDGLKRHALRILLALLPRVPAGADGPALVHGSFEGTPFTVRARARPWKLAGRYAFENGGRELEGSAVKWDVTVEVAA